MSKEHVGGVACHCIICTFFCVSSFLSQVFIRCGLVTAFRLGLGLGLPGDDEASLFRSGEEYLRHAPQWCTVRGLWSGSKMAHVLCRHVVPGVESQYAVRNKPNAFP
jgi:hypothetical protein